MQLTLTIESAPDLGSTGQAVRFGTEGGTIGRGADRDFVLHDPECYASSLHATIDFADGAFRLTDQSTNGTYHNAPDDLIGKNRSVGLHSGDLLYVGNFVLRVEIDDAEDQEQWSDAPDRFGSAAAQADHEPDSFETRGDTRENVSEPDSARPSVGSDWDTSDFSPPWDDRPDPAAAAESFDDESDEPQPSRSPEREFFPAPSVREPSGEAIPDDWDEFLTGFFDAPGRGSKDKSAGMDEKPDLPVADEGGPGNDADRAAAPADAFEPPVARSAPKSRVTTERPDPAPSDQPGETPVPSRPPTAAPERQPAYPEATAAPERDEILMAVTHGLMALLSSRSEIKNEFRIDQTRFASSENNPLKFSPTAEEALRRIMGSDDSSGFLTGKRAFEEALDDLQAHQLAVLSAVQQAIQSVVSQFNPDALEKKLEKVSPISARTPGLRAAKCWNLFTLQYEDIAGRMRDDAKRIFLNEFADAYESVAREIAEKRGPSKQDDK